MGNPGYIRAWWMAVMLAMAGMAAPAYAVNQPLVVGKPVSSDDLSAFTKWTSLMPRYEEQEEEPVACATAETGKPCLDKKWETLLEKAKDKSVAKQMEMVNSFFNKIPYINDIDNWGMDDYWATPHEFMSRGGDCEDYAIAKYISLKRLGFDEDDMRIIIVRDNNLNGEMHAVLQVTVDNVAYILDNQASQVIRAARIYHYAPIYAINATNWWAYI